MGSTRKTIFELERRSNLYDDYVDIFCNVEDTNVNSNEFNNTKLIDVIEASIKTWPYREGASTISSFARKHGFEFNDATDEEDIIYAFELLINLLKWAPVNDRNRESIWGISVFGKLTLKSECDRCLENIEYILETINMRIHETQNDPFPQYFISKRSVDVDAVIEVVPEMSEVLLSYLDIRNQKDEEAKKAVLKAIADYLEPKRADYKGTVYHDLCEALFTVFNKASIRHNDKKQWNLRKPERIKLYDQTFKAAIHLMQMADVIAFNNRVTELKKAANTGTD